jgi:Ca-activated chloride channel homolog
MKRKQSQWIQGIEFNPAHFDSYRLIGYENRVMAKEDFNNDKKDAGELGAGHTVTAFYELVPTGVEVVPGVDPLKYQAVEKIETTEPKDPIEANPEWLTVKLRYKLPKEDTSTKIEIPFTGTFAPFGSASEDFRFAAGVAAGGLLMRQDSRAGSLTFREVIGWTSATTGNDPHGYRREYIDLLKNAAVLSQ